MWNREGKAVEAHPGACPLGFALAAGFATSVIGGLLAALAAPPHQTTTRLVVLALIIAGFAAAIRNLPGTVLTAGMAWSIYLGFLVDQTGELHWHGIVDLVRLGVLVVAALAGSARWPVIDLLSAHSAPARPATARPATAPATTAGAAGPRGWPSPLSAVHAPRDPAERARLTHAAGARPPR